MIIVGVGHKAQTGKDTVGKYLADHYDFKVVSFADHLRYVCSVVTGIPLNQFYGEAKKTYNETWGMTHREILQTLGSNGLRDGFHKEVWIKSAFAKLKPGERYVFTDVRFPNEARAISEAGGFLIRTDRDTDGYEIDRNHQSETSLDNYEHWDYIINNNGELYRLYMRVNQIMAAENIVPYSDWQRFKRLIKRF